MTQLNKAIIDGCCGSNPEEMRPKKSNQVCCGSTPFRPDLDTCCADGVKLGQTYCD